MCCKLKIIASLIKDFLSRAQNLKNFLKLLSFPYCRAITAQVYLHYSTSHLVRINPILQAAIKFKHVVNLMMRTNKHPCFLLFNNYIH